LQDLQHLQFESVEERATLRRELGFLESGIESLGGDESRRE